ncbi:type II toxin-antitoxin system RelE/ParE family toxin [Shuttleworthella satelles]|uniref:Toxin-antitoxin system, toxin component, RelE family n=1 Tax=Shuttleworthella satelles DSM 14600 TaxID=626523 RepID=C4GDK8_9FIRM|nr:type II toxin-antitoxin system RelE/ParE family toxin [Shuttleworthia satelles]EEP27487.1 toxin-antitoxin system, toxin component, RelE family [Shuttleworthia satelles DSM 14600]
MNSYEIIMTPDATTDLVELRDYIADVLLVPDTALSYIRAIREEISKLSEMPGRIKPVDDEPWHSRGIREIMAKNFYVYYRIDEETKRVYIMNVIYNKRDQLRQLANMKLD